MRGDYPNGIIMPDKNKKSQSIHLIKQLKRYKKSISIIINGGIMSYSPKIKKDLVKKLYQLKHSTSNKPPMTTMVNEAVEEYLKKKQSIKPGGKL